MQTRMRQAPPSQVLQRPWMAVLHSLRLRALHRQYVLHPAGLMIMGEYGLAAEGLTIGTFILNNLIPATIRKYDQRDAGDWRRVLAGVSSGNEKL